MPVIVALIEQQDQHPFRQSCRRASGLVLVLQLNYLSSIGYSLAMWLVLVVVIYLA